MKPTKLHAVLPLFALAFAANGAYAQGWKPERNVELILPASPGGSNDIAGRTIQKVWTDLNLLPVSSSVVNRTPLKGRNVIPTLTSRRRPE